MKNFWLEKAKADEAKATGEFIDLSNVPSTGGRYKEYERLNNQEIKPAMEQIAPKPYCTLKGVRPAEVPLMESHDERDKQVKIDWARMMKPFDFSAGLKCGECDCDEEDIPKEIKLDASDIPNVITLDVPPPDDAVTVPADKTVHASIQDGVIDPKEVIWGQQGEWTVCKTGGLTSSFRFTASPSWTDEHVQSAVASYEVDIVNQQITVGIYDVLEGKLVWSWLMPQGPDPALTLRTYDPNGHVAYKATFHDVKLCSHDCTYSYRGDGSPVEHITGFKYTTMDLESDPDEMGLFPGKPDDNPHDEEWQGTGFAPKFKNDQP